MSTIKSDNSDLTINASGTSKDIKFQADGTEVASISNTGILTATSFVGDGSTLSNVGVDGIVSTANATAITIDSNENVGIGVTPEISTNTTGLYVGSRTAVVNWGNGSYFPHNAYESSSSWKYRDTAAAGIYSRNNNGDHVFEVAPSGTADAAISFTTGLEVLNSGKARAKNGIMFGTDTSANNALDDYEEGTWTPVPTNCTGTASDTNYTKIGDTVHIWGRINFTGASGEIQIYGLPYAPANNQVGGSIMLTGANIGGGSTYNVIVYFNSTSRILIYTSEDNSSWNTLSNSHIGNGDQIIFNGFYKV
jgi:hypothetical protein